MITRRGGSYFNEGNLFLSLHWGKQNLTQGELWLMKWENRHHCIDLFIMFCIMVPSALWTKVCGPPVWVEVMNSPRLLSLDRVTFLASEWEMERQYPAQNLDHSGASLKPTDQLPEPVSQHHRDTAAHSNQQNLNFQHCATQTEAQGQGWLRKHNY